MTLPAANSHATVDARAKSGAIGRRQRRRELYRPDEDMSRAGLVRAFERLTFRDGCCLLSVDQGIRNYLSDWLRARRRRVMDRSIAKCNNEKCGR